LVECNLAKVDVEGSNPFARSGVILPAGGVIRIGRGQVFFGTNPFARSGALLPAKSFERIALGERGKG
jgi:hypothetical protein